MVIPSKLHITLLGEIHIAVADDTGCREVVFRSRKGLALLAYLALHAGAWVPRAQVAGLFWADAPEDQAHTNLRKALYHLRHELPQADQFIETGPGGIRIPSNGTVRVDAVEYFTALRRANLARRVGDIETEQYALEAAVETDAGELLPGLYDEWVLQEREVFQRERITALQRLARLLENRRMYAEAIATLRRLQDCDPLIEETYRQLMRLHAMYGERAKALLVYRECEEVLHSELGVAPDASIRAAYEQLLTHSRDPIPAAPALLDGAVRLVGRVAEWDQIQSTWESAPPGRPALVLISGEAGIGKTRLLEEISGWARAQQIELAQAVCYEAEGVLDLAPVAAWLRARPLPAVETAWLQEAARLVPEAARGMPVPPAGQGLAQRQRLFEGLTRALLAGRSALILTLDNIQWCDGETLAFLHYLLRASQDVRLLVACTFRSDLPFLSTTLTLLLDNLRRAGSLVEIPLSPLNEAETAELGRRVARGRLTLAQLSNLYRETEGNPLFVVEMVRSGQHGTPPGIQAVIATRLARLSAPARELAGIAAVIGQAFSFDLLREASGFDELALLQSYEELLQRRILFEREGPGELDFTHDKIREGMAAMLSTARRKFYHRRVAQGLEACSAHEPEIAAARIAMHYDQAGLPAEAARVRGEVRRSSQRAGQPR